jgi:hypothetical protein
MRKHGKLKATLKPNMLMKGYNVSKPGTYWKKDTENIQSLLLLRVISHPFKELFLHHVFD